MAIWFAQLSVDRWRHTLAPEAGGVNPGEGADALPTVLIIETAHGPRIEAVNTAGHEAGARVGMMLADARTLCPDIQTAPADPAGDLDFLEKLALWSQRWGPWSALDPPDGVLVDITAAAHLFGGERRLLADVEEAFAQRKLHVRTAIAPTAGAAWALAHFGPPRAILGAEANGIQRLADLPVAALRLDTDVLTVLRRLGLKRLGDLAAIASGPIDQAEAAARDAIHRRFRNRKSPSANPLVRLDQLLGKVPEPLLPIVPQHAPLVQRRLMEPIRHRSLLDQVLSDLADDMVRELEAQRQGARRLELGLWRVDGEVTVRRLELASATREAEHITRLFTDKLEGIDAGFGIETVRLRASWTEPLGASQGDVEEAAERHGTSLNACIDRLTVRLGPHRVRRPVSYPSHLPERAQRWQPPLDPEPSALSPFALRDRPLKLLDRAEAIAVLYASPDGLPQRFRWRGNVHEVARVEGPERIAPEWWREKSTVRLRDYYRIEDAEGHRYWIYRHGIAGDGRGGAPDWYLQGIYA
ncbi:DNA polymerase Y family protein [Erythrobacter crassostreae]|uniref:DNA polymerase Y family protein n=1 Tax=Erythrobacter crassostreae TaxID=2828328 RepID=UPI002105AD4B|nr:DNA polymerase Y family protein [Erythrobacter crassostrea]